MPEIRFQWIYLPLTIRIKCNLLSRNSLNFYIFMVVNITSQSSITLYDLMICWTLLKMREKKGGGGSSSVDSNKKNECQAKPSSVVLNDAFFPFLILSHFKSHKIHKRITDECILNISIRVHFVCLLPLFFLLYHHLERLPWQTSPVEGGKQGKIMSLRRQTNELKKARRVRRWKCIVLTLLERLTASQFCRSNGMYWLKGEKLHTHRERASDKNKTKNNHYMAPATLNYIFTSRIWAAEKNERQRIARMHINEKGT